MTAEPPKKRGRKSADGTRAPLTMAEAIQNEILRSNIKYIPNAFKRYGLTEVQQLAVIRREPRNELEREARTLLDPHRSQGGGRGENRGGVARQAAELAAWLISTDGISPAKAKDTALEMLALGNAYPDKGTVDRELRRMNPVFPAVITDVSISDISGLP
jgi:hypothetical protein